MPYVRKEYLYKRGVVAVNNKNVKIVEGTAQYHIIVPRMIHQDITDRNSVTFPEIALLRHEIQSHIVQQNCGAGFSRNKSAQFVEQRRSVFTDVQQ